MFATDCIMDGVLSHTVKRLELDVNESSPHEWPRQGDETVDYGAFALVVQSTNYGISQICLTLYANSRICLFTAPLVSASRPYVVPS